MRLIGLNGRLHSGKDTAVQYIRQSLPAAVVERRGFADKLKVSAAAALGCDFTEAETAIVFCDLLKEDSTIRVAGPEYGYIISGRQFLQQYGTEAHRNVFGDEFWVDALLPQPSDSPVRDNWEVETERNLREAFPGIDVLVITDVRFPNEARRIRRLGGEVWWIDADRRLGVLPADAHESERQLPADLITHRVPNNGDLEQFGYSIHIALGLPHAH